MNVTAGPSYWEATAPPARYETARLAADLSVEVAVIGGGYTGLAAANHLARSYGLEPLVIEANQVGAGASGRNAGMVVPHVGKVPLAQQIARFGEEHARALIDLGRKAVQRLADLVKEHRLDVAWQPAAWAVEAATPQLATGLHTQHELLQTLGSTSTRFVGPAGGTVTGRYGALVYDGCATVHPLALARELAALAVSGGARIAENTAVAAIEPRSDGVDVHLRGGVTVRARRLVIATNGYTGRFAPQPLRGTIARFRAYVVSTAPLTDEQWHETLHAGQFTTDNRKLVRYWRRLPDGGLLFGSPGPVLEWASDRQGVRAAIGDLRQRFPHLAGIEIRHGWKGYIGAAYDRMPHVTRLYGIGAAAMGYAGTGVALAVTAGQAAADYALGSSPPPEVAPLVQPLPKFPVPALLPSYPTAARAGFAWKDRVG